MTIVYIILGCIIVVSLVVGIILTKKENKSTGANTSLIQQESVNGAIEMLKESSNTKEVTNTSSSVNTVPAVDVVTPPVVSSPISTSVTPLPVDNSVGEGVVSTPVNNVVQQVPNVDNQTVVTPTVLVQSVDDDSEVL